MSHFVGERKPSPEKPGLIDHGDVSDEAGDGVSFRSKGFALVLAAPKFRRNFLI